MSGPEAIKEFSLTPLPDGAAKLVIAGVSGVGVEYTLAAADVENLTAMLASRWAKYHLTHSPGVKVQS